VNEKKTEVQAMTNEQTQILLEAIKIIAEKSESREDFLTELNRLQAIKKPQ
jgi:hypothetical protein